MVPGTIFGDYQHIFGLQSNIVYRAQGDLIPDSQISVRQEQGTKVAYMAVSVDVWDRLCELYPETKEMWKDYALLKREVTLHYLVRATELTRDRRQTGIPSALAVS